METRGFVLQKVEESYAALCQRLAGAALTGQHSGTWGLRVPLGTFLPEHVPGGPTTPYAGAPFLPSWPLPSASPSCSGRCRSGCPCTLPPPSTAGRVPRGPLCSCVSVTLQAAACTATVSVHVRSGCGVRLRDPHAGVADSRALVSVPDVAFFPR